MPSVQQILKFLAGLQSQKIYDPTLTSKTSWIPTPAFRFSCSCSSSLSYMGMLTHNFSCRVSEHLGFHLKTESFVKDHIMFCNICGKTKYNANSLKIIKNVILILKLNFTKLY